MEHSSEAMIHVLVLIDGPGYEWTRAAFEKAAVRAGRANKKLATMEYIIAGAIAGSATVLITNPIWVVNTRMTARKQESDEQSSLGAKPRKPPSTIGTFVSLVQNEGVASLFKGVLPALVLVVNPILQYTIFEQLKNLLAKRRKVTPTDAFYFGAIGKLLATGITYPYITIKSRMHVASKGDNKQNTLESLKRVVDEEGWAGLYKGLPWQNHVGGNVLLTVSGLGPKLAQSVLTAAFLFAFKDALYDLSIQARQRLAQRSLAKRLA